MSSQKPDEPSFAEEMARMGVTPLGKKSGARGGKAARPVKKPGRRDAAPSKLGGLGPQITKVAAAARAAAPADVPARAGKAETYLDRELAELRRELVRVQEASRALEVKHAAWETERAAWETERAAWQAERARWDAERESWQRERSRLQTSERTARQALAQVEKAMKQRADLMDVMRARGCVSEDEAVFILSGLLQTRPAELLAAMELSDPESLVRLLDQRVALVAEGLDIELGTDCVVLRVSPERCEISEGSDIQVAFRLFADACGHAGVHRVTIVGGSPAYRRQLKHLAAGQELRLNLVSGTQRREKKRADADLRTSDLVVIWGATELDHSVSNQYIHGAQKPLQVRHRGILRMLRAVTEHLERSR